MNIFYLSPDPKVCAQMHLDKHVVKMILEYAQLLSTAHRVIDGTETQGLSKTGRKVKRWIIERGTNIQERNSVLYTATHINHPSAKWARHTGHNYYWLYCLLYELCKEYTHRYGKTHVVETKLLPTLALVPNGLETGEFTPPWRAMPDEYKVGDDSMASYRNYYVGAKARMAKWTKREIPEWFTSMLHSKSNTGEIHAHV